MKVENTLDINVTSAWRTIEELYAEAFYPVARYISKNGGSLEDARDLFHDALVILYHDLQDGKVIVSQEHYVVGISKNLWRSKTKERAKTNRIEESDDVTEQQEQSVNENKLLSLLKLTGNRCLELLSAIYYGNESVHHVAGKFGYSGEHSVSVQKYKCLEKIRETIRTKSISYEDLFE